MRILLSIAIVAIILLKGFSQADQGVAQYESVFSDDYLESMYESLPPGVLREDQFRALYAKENIKLLFRGDQSIQYKTRMDSSVDLGDKLNKYLPYLRWPNIVLHRDGQTQKTTTVIIPKQGAPTESQGDLIHIEWYQTGQQETVLGYPCLVAIRYDGEDSTRVCFAPSIESSAGPSDCYGLPGLVLKVETAKLRIVARSLELRAIPAEYVRPPQIN